MSKNNLCMLSLLRPFLCKHCRHAPDDPSDASHAFSYSSCLFHEVDQAVKHQQDAVVRLRRGHLEEATLLGQGEQPSLLARDAAVPLQVAFVCHDDDGDRGRLPASTYLLQLLLDNVEAAAITHVVDEDHPVSPLQLFVADGGTLLSRLWRKQTHKL